MTVACSPRTAYFLMPHVYSCVRDDYVVLFDVANGKYLAITSRQSRLLAELVVGWPGVRSDRPPENETSLPDSVLPPSQSRFVERLCQRGLLTASATIGKSAVPVQAHVPTQTFPVFSLDRSLTPYWKFLPSFLLACARSRWLIRHRRFIEIVDRIQTRRACRANHHCDESLLGTLVRAHHYLRVLVYTVKDQCLYDSLVFLEFLAAYHVDATWVFGVHTWPWIPHCWVRVGNYVLNDTTRNVVHYSVLAEF